MRHRMDYGDLDTPSAHYSFASFARHRGAFARRALGPMTSVLASTEFRHPATGRRASTPDRVQGEEAADRR